MPNGKVPARGASHLPVSIRRICLINEGSLRLYVQIGENYNIRRANGLDYARCHVSSWSGRGVDVARQHFESLIKKIANI